MGEKDKSDDIIDLDPLQFASINIEDTRQLEHVYRTILLCGEHSSNASWTNEERVCRSKEILSKLLATLQFEDLSSFLTACGSKCQLHGVNLFMLLTPKLSKNEWKEHPASVQCYRWLLRSINTRMGDFLEFVLPVCLNILSDYEVENKVTALECLSRILRNVSSAELSWFVEMKLLKNLMTPLFYYREADLIRPLIECTLEIVAKANPPFTSVQDLEWNFMDDIFTILLPMMEYEQDIDRRCAYSKCLPDIIKRNKIRMVKWSPKILRIIDDYSKTSITEVEAMNALNEFALHCWPFLKDHWRFINVVAGRILYRSNNEDAIKTAEVILQNLKQCVPPDSDFKSVEYIKCKRAKNTK